MRARLQLTYAGFALLLAAGACNLVTGADGISLADDDDEGTTNGAGGTTTQGSNGAGGNPATGGSSMSGGGDTSMSAGGQMSTPASSSSGGELCGGAGPTTTPLDSEEQAFVTIINNYRAQNSLGPLTPCVSLNRAAQGHSEDMRDNNYFSHTGLNGSTPWDRACEACFDLGCGPMTAMAENIAAGNSGAQATFDQWKNSPGHNANMLDGSFAMIGIGRAVGGGQYGVYWTNVFAGEDEPSCY